MKRLIKTFVFSVILLIITLVILELILQVFDFPKKSMMFSNANNEGYNRYVKSVEFHHDYRPNQSFYRWASAQDEFGNVYNEINELGYRGEIPVEDSTIKKVLLLGDSFMEADEINEDSTAAKLLKQKYPYIDFVQKGMSSWSPLLEMNWYNKIGKKFKPKHVFLFLCINDFYKGSEYEFCDESYESEMKYESGQIKFEMDESNNNLKLTKWYYYSKVVCLIKLFSKFKSSDVNSNLENTQFSQEQLDELLNISADKFEIEVLKFVSQDNPIRNEIVNLLRLSRPKNLWDSSTNKRVFRSFFWIKKLKNQVELNGGKLHVGFIPLGWNINLKECEIGREYYGFKNITIPIGGISEAIIEFCKNENINYLNIEYPFTEAAKFNQLYLRNDGHLNSYGTSILSKIIARQLE